MTDGRKSKKSREKGSAEPALDDQLIKLVDSLPPPAEFADRVIEAVPHAQSIRVYLKEIGRFPVLSESEELTLVKSIQDNPEPKTRKKLAEANIRLAAWIAKEYANGEALLSDLINEGTLALIGAVDSFDPLAGRSFRLHAAAWIRRAVSETVAYETSLSRIPEYLLEKIESIKPVSERLLNEMGREPTREELADELGFSADELDRLVKLVGHSDGKEEASQEDIDAEMEDDDEDEEDRDYY